MACFSAWVFERFSILTVICRIRNEAVSVMLGTAINYASSTVQERRECRSEDVLSKTTKCKFTQALKQKPDQYYR